MAGSRRGRYPPEFKERIVELARAGRSPGSLAREFEDLDPTAHGNQKATIAEAFNARRSSKFPGTVSNAAKTSGKAAIGIEHSDFLG